MRYTQPSENGPDERNPFEPGFRAVISPALSLGAHWFVYSALEADSTSYFAYETGVPEGESVQVHLMQAFIGCTRCVSKASILIKAGQLNSTFGLFPIEYDDAKMPPIDPPLLYEEEQEGKLVPPASGNITAAIV